MRWLAVPALLLLGCNGDILPIQLPGSQFFIEAGRLPGAMQQVRVGLSEPIAAGGGTDPLLLERQDGGWVPLVPPDAWSGPILDVAVVGSTLFLSGEDGQLATGGRTGLEMIAADDAEGTSLRALLARADDDVFIAGDGGLFHFDGSTVRRVETTSIAASQDFYALWAGGTTIFAGGAEGVVLTIGGTEATATQTGTVATIRALHGRSRTDLYAVGGDQRAAVLKWDGEAWSDLALPFMPPLRAVFAGSAGVWVAGYEGYLARWDGERWIELATPWIVPITGTLERDGELYLTGGNIDDPSASGFVARYGD